MYSCWNCPISTRTLLVIWAVIIAGQYVIKKILENFMKCCGVDPKRICQIFLILGYLNLFFCGVIPRYVAFYQGTGPADSLIPYLVFYFCLVTVAPCYYFFISQTKKSCKFIFEKTDKISWIILLLHVLFLAFTLWKSQEDSRTTHQILLCELSFFVICAWSMVEFFMVVRGKVQYDEERRGEEMKALNGEDVPEVVATRSDQCAAKIENPQN